MLRHLAPRIVPALAVLFLALPLHAGEDTVLSTIKEATRQYQAGDYSGSASNLDYASQLIRQKKSEKMKDLLPEPLPGWDGKEASAQALGAAVLGGGVTVSRDYTRGASSISVEIVSDSPVLQSVLMMLNNPVFAGAGGGRLETVKGNRSVLKFDSGQEERRTLHRRGLALRRHRQGQAGRPLRTCSPTARPWITGYWKRTEQAPDSRRQAGGAPPPDNTTMVCRGVPTRFFPRGNGYPCYNW